MRATGSYCRPRAMSVMQPELPSENPEPVRKLLREWKVNAPLPPQFAEGVWRRIERADVAGKPSLWVALRHWLSTAVPRPAVAVGYVTVLLVAGVATGYVQARNETVRVKGELGVRYVQSVDPYQKPGF